MKMLLLCAILLISFCSLGSGFLPHELLEYKHELEILARYNNSLELALKDMGVQFTTAVELIEMRDGVKLYTVIYTPLFGREHGCILERTSYTTVYAPALALRWLPLGFALALQDQRGSGISRGDNFQFWRMDGVDAYDTMAYLTSQSWSNGNIYLTGASSMGNAACAALLELPPWIKAMGPAVATANGHKTTYQGGAFRQGLVQNWLTVLGFVFTLQEVKENEAFGPWWYPITIDGNEDKCNVPSVMSTGWYDLFLNENIDAFNICQYVTNSSAARGNQKIVINPHGHCVSGDYIWPNSWSLLPQDMRASLFMEIEGLQVPKDIQKRVEAASAITMYIMGPSRNGGEVGNYWTTLPHWPVANNVAYYLHADSRSLSLDPSASPNASISYMYDPDDPVRTNGGNELFLPCGPRRQDEIGSRHDVIEFVSQPFTQPMAIVGNVSAVLYVSTSAPDTDFTVKISDEYSEESDKRSYNLCDGIVRMRWRNINTQPELPTPGYIYEITVDLWKTAYIFNVGHSIRVDISSSNHPRFEKNPNNGLPITENGPSVVALNTIYLDRGHPSRIILPVVSLDDIPNNYDI